MRRSMLKCGRHPEAFSGSFNGCSCHNKKSVRRRGKKAAKANERRAWRRENGL